MSILLVSMNLIFESNDVSSANILHADYKLKTTENLKQSLAVLLLVYLSILLFAH